MVRLFLAMIFLSSALFTVNANAMSAACAGKFRNMNLKFFAQGSLLHKRDGSGFVKINNRIVAQFDGDAARINYLRKSFSIRNDRGDYVEGKVLSFSTGASTLTRMDLPGEGIRVVNVPVNCSVD